MSGEPTLLHHLLDDRAARTPDATAVRGREQTWTYAELRARSVEYAHGLVAAGVRRGDRVVVLGEHEPDTVALLFALSRIAAIQVVLGERTPPSRLARIIDDARPVLAVTDHPVPGCRGLPVSELAGHISPPLPHEGISADPVGIIYTSGSTAAPKGVVSCHRQVVFVARAIQSRLRYRADDVVFCALPLSFDYGLYQVYLCVLAGACLVLADDTDAGATLVATLNRCHATVLPLLAPLAATLVALVSRTSRPPAALRLITSSGAALDDALARGLRALIPNAALVGMFGLTECKRVTVGEPQELITFPGSCGRALPDTEIYTVDAHGNRLPPGEVGELVVRGPHVMSGYWGDPVLTAARFPRDELGEARLHTGDQCRIDADGRLYFVGRADDIYKQRGVRVSVLEVEEAALRVPGVRAAAALPPGNGRGALLVVEGDVTPLALRVGIGQHIEELKVPDECHVLRALPVSPNGKIDKRALRALLSEPAAS